MFNFLKLSEKIKIKFVRFFFHARDINYLEFTLAAPTDAEAVLNPVGTP